MNNLVPTRALAARYLLLKCVRRSLISVGAPSTALRSRSIGTNCRRRAVERVREEQQQQGGAVSTLFEFHGKWPEQEQQHFIKDMRLLTNFISVEEETKLLEEIEPYMKRLHYEYDHWDDAIHGFRETERKQWYPHNRSVLERVRQVAFDGAIMPYLHILDLAAEGVIKPHVDSTRYCGCTIAGISLLSDSVMRMVRVDEQKYRQSKSGESDAASPAGDAYRSRPNTTLENNFYADVLLQRRSLYIMSHTSRYNFTHEILAQAESKFQGKPVEKERRISIICRNEP